MPSRSSPECSPPCQGGGQFAATCLIEMVYDFCFSASHQKVTIFATVSMDRMGWHKLLQTIVYIIFKCICAMRNRSKEAGVRQLIGSAVQTDPAAQNAPMTSSPPATVCSYNRSGVGAIAARE